MVASSSIHRTDNFNGLLIDGPRSESVHRRRNLREEHFPEILEHTLSVRILFLIISVSEVLIRRLHRRDKKKVEIQSINESTTVEMDLFFKYSIIDYLIRAYEVEVKDSETADEPDRHKSVSDENK